MQVLPHRFGWVAPSVRPYSFHRFRLAERGSRHPLRFLIERTFFDRSVCKTPRFAYRFAFLGGDVCKTGGFAYKSGDFIGDVCRKGGFAYKSGELGVDVCKKGGFAYGVSEKCVTLRQITN